VAAPALLEPLWQVVLSSTEGRVQEKAWDAFLEIITRSGNIALLQQWDKGLTAAHQPTRRVQMLAAVSHRWRSRPETQTAGVKAEEALVQAQLELGRWSAAVPLVRDLLARSEDADLPNRLAWLVVIGEQALKEGNRAEALRMVQEAQPYLKRASKMADQFEKLEKLACNRESR
jgi:hypothetical protein